MALDIIWNDGKLPLQGGNISSLVLCFFCRFAIPKKKRPQNTTNEWNKINLIQFNSKFLSIMWSMWQLWMRAVLLFQIPLFPLSSTNFKTYQ